MKIITLFWATVICSICDAQDNPEAKAAPPVIFSEHLIGLENERSRIVIHIGGDSPDQPGELCELDVGKPAAIKAGEIRPVSGLDLDYTMGVCAIGVSKILVALAEIPYCNTFAQVAVLEKSVDGKWKCTSRHKLFENEKISIRPMKLEGGVADHVIEIPLSIYAYGEKGYHLKAGKYPLTIRPIEGNRIKVSYFSGLGNKQFEQEINLGGA